MKYLFYTMFSVLILGACAGSQNLAEKRVGDNIILDKEEGEEYELTIIDPTYTSWFATNAKPINYYSKSYYETKNNLYVTSWNALYDQTGGSGPFGNRINYDPHTDYGLELNYELFWYFKYIESRYGAFYNFPI